MELGQTIGRYTLLEQVGKGGMAEVFKAEERLPDGSARVVAIKRLFPRLAADREFVGMFVNEARIASAMLHPNVIKTYDLVNSGSYYYIVMEFLAGMDLEDLISLAPPEHMALTLHEAAYVVHEVALGLGYAHRGGADPNAGPVVHRDISPGNILVDCEGQVRITDFGIARAAQYAQVTRPGILKGKYEYMAPEYVAGKNFDGRADLFSLGVVFYELLTGTNPFLEVMPQDVWDKVLGYDPPPPSSLSPEVPRAIDEIVAQALAKAPDKRIRTGEVFAQLLQPFFSTKGKHPVTSLLGKRVTRSMQHSVQQASLCAEDDPVAAFLPEDDDEPGGDATTEIHLDELLELVEPQEVPRPNFKALTRERDTGEGPTVKVPTREQRGPRLRDRKRPWPYVGLGAAAALALGLMVWLLWPAPTGFLTVTSDRRVEVYVDAKRMGLAPLTRLPLSPGQHVIEVRRPGTNRTKTYQREIAVDEETALKVTWRKPRASKRRRRAKRRRRGKRRSRKRKRKRR